MAHYLVQTKFYDLDELPVCLLPEEVRVEHYMHLRLAIKRCFCHKVIAACCTMSHTVLC